MIPSRVYFSGFDLDPLPLIRGRKHRGPIPSPWLRVRFITDDASPLGRLDQWIMRNFDHPFASYVVSLAHNKRVVVIAFENDTDAVLFKLRSGETAWTETEDEAPNH